MKNDTFINSQNIFILTMLLFCYSCTNPFQIGEIVVESLDAGNISQNPSPTPAVNQVTTHLAVSTDLVSVDIDNIFLGKTTSSGDYISSVEILTQPTHGTIVSLATSLIFNPQIGYTGTDSFVYRAKGQNGTYETGPSV